MKPIQGGDELVLLNVVDVARHIPRRRGHVWPCRVHSAPVYLFRVRVERFAEDPLAEHRLGERGRASGVVDIGKSVGLLVVERGR